MFVTVVIVYLDKFLSKNLEKKIRRKNEICFSQS